MDVRLPDGTILRNVPEGTTKEQLQAKLAGRHGIEPLPSSQPEAKPSSRWMDLLGAAEAGATMVTGAAAEPVAGVAGMVQSLNPLADKGAGAKAVQATRQAMTYEPMTQEGRDMLGRVARVLSPVTNVINKAEQFTGDVGYDLAGPTGGAIGAAVPAALSEIAGVALARTVGKAGRVANAVPDDQAASILRAGKEFNVPVMTSDVRPPKGYAGRFAQSVSEKLGPLGSGTARVSQQKAREAAIQAFAENMDIDLDSPFAAKMVSSLNAKLAAEMKAAGQVRDEAVRSLDTFGPVPLTKTTQAVADEIAKQVRLGPKGDQALIQSLADTLDAANGGDFSLIKDIRSEVILDLKAITKGEHTLPSKAAASVQRVKSAMDKDMVSFAASNDRQAAAKWIRSNRTFADAYTRAKDTELRRVLKSGEATPENIMPILRGGKKSELVRLAKSMGEKGREAARKAIIQDALKESKFFEVDANPNPDVFANALNKASRQQAINVFFQGDGKQQIDGLTRLLDATRRAQQGSAVVKTGEQFIPAAIASGTGIGLYAEPVTASAIVGTTAGILKAYESRPFRNLLLKLSNTPKGSTAEKRILDAAGLFAAGGLQAAKERQPEEQQTQ